MLRGYVASVGSIGPVGYVIRSVLRVKPHRFPVLPLLHLRTPCYGILLRTDVHLSMGTKYTITYLKKKKNTITWKFTNDCI